MTFGLGSGYEFFHGDGAVVPNQGRQISKDLFTARYVIKNAIKETKRVEPFNIYAIDIKINLTI